ncbi:MAG: hypothetical protein JOZ25_10360 [Actinobacteria bacterium]|nr:hypothetical protein [Actinomycetota bacterium]
MTWCLGGLVSASAEAAHFKLSMGGWEVDGTGQAGGDYFTFLGPSGGTATYCKSKPNGPIMVTANWGWKHASNGQHFHYKLSPPSGKAVSKKGKFGGSWSLSGGASVTKKHAPAGHYTFKVSSGGKTATGSVTVVAKNC